MAADKWYQNLTGGINQATNPFLVDNNESPFLLNCMLDQTGTWATRRGTALKGARIGTSDGMWGLMALHQDDGTKKLFSVTDRDLYVLNEGTSSWGSAIDTDEWPATTRVDGVKFLNRLYIGSEDGATPLAYTTGGAITDITPTIGGSKLAVCKNILAVGGNSIKRNIIFYTNAFTDTFHKATGTCAANADVAGANTVTATTEIFTPDMIGSVLYNTTDGAMNVITGWTSGTVVTTDTATSTWDNDTVYVLKNNFKLDGSCTGNITFKENFVSWDEDKIYMWDPIGEWSSELEGFGCSNYRTVAIGGGYLFWMNREGIYKWDGSSRPEDISKKLKDKINGLGVWDTIDMSKLAEFAAGVDNIQDKYYLSVSDMATVSGAPSSALTNIVLIYDIQKEAWTVEQYPNQPVVYRLCGD
jgi:hypothetical protein